MADRLSDPEPIDAKERVENLRATFESRRRALVLTHDNPDPDALASAFVLAAVLAHLTDVECEVGYAGIIGRAENRAMLRELDLAPARIHGDTLQRFDAIALVDTQPGFGNNSLPEDRQATAVVDHHPGRDDLADVANVDELSLGDRHISCSIAVHCVRFLENCPHVQRHS